VTFQATEWGYPDPGRWPGLRWQGPVGADLCIRLRALPWAGIS